MNAHDTAGPVACDTEALNTLLRGELSAVESYDRAVPGFEGQPAAAELHRLRAAHAEAVVVLRDRVIHAGGTPADGAGAWGAFTAVVTGAAQAVGPATVLRALQEGENHGASEYEDALTGDRLDPDTANLIRARLLPLCQEHLLHLDRLLAGR
jgi:hypothetical protein